jgi:peptide-methionine (S)-S-oxide reductase
MLPLRQFSLRRLTPFVIVAAVFGFAALQPWAMSSAAEDAVVIPAPLIDEQPGPQASEIAVLAGGCFWGVQGVFQHVAGVTRAVSGYAGGQADTAHYDMVSSGTTGHAESVQITFDPARISYGRILQIYFSVAHDPTQLNYQGPDMGTQYRSTIFATSEEQARVAKAYIAQLDQAHVYSDPVVTTVDTGRTFYPAEDYHQDFLSRNPTYPYIVFNDLPKIENLKRIFPAMYRDDPVLVMAGKSGN